MNFVNAILLFGLFTVTAGSGVLLISSQSSSSSDGPSYTNEARVFVPGDYFVYDVIYDDFLKDYFATSEGTFIHSFTGILEDENQSKCGKPSYEMTFSNIINEWNYMTFSSESNGYTPIVGEDVPCHLELIQFPLDEKEWYYQEENSNDSFQVNLEPSGQLKVGAGLFETWKSTVKYVTEEEEKTILVFEGYYAPKLSTLR